MDQAAVIKMVAANKCDVKDWKLEDQQIGKIDADTYVLSYKGTFEGSSAGLNGKSTKIPSPIRAATVWVRTGSTWQAAFHGQNLLSDPNNQPSAKTQAKKAEAKKAETKEGDKATANSNTAAPIRPLTQIPPL